MLQQARLAEALNLALHDGALRWRPLPSAAELPVRVIAIGEDDLRRFGAPVDDRYLVTAIQRLETAGVRAIGLDLYRDLGVGPQRQELRELAARPGPWAKLRLAWFVLIAAVRDLPLSWGATRP